MMNQKMNQQKNQKMNQKMNIIVVKKKPLIKKHIVIDVEEVDIIQIHVMLKSILKVII